MHNYQEQHEDFTLTTGDKIFLCISAAMFFVGMGLMIWVECLG